jgi:uncharacterized membrane protein SpoIIM required for sporulation
VIASLHRFILQRRPLWEEYEALLKRLEDDVSIRLELGEIQRLRFLHESVAGDLMRVRTFTVDPETTTYLESLLARGFGFIHDNRGVRLRVPVRKSLNLFAQTFRSHLRPFWLVVTALMLGAVLGGFLVVTEPNVKEVILPFDHLLGDPAERVALEESTDPAVAEAHSRFAAQLMANNIRVSILVLVLGIFYGVLTLVVVFYNGVILGAVIVDYIVAGQSVFLTAWLLPHGSVEIPAILFSAQAGLLIARAVMIPEGRLSAAARLRRVRRPVCVLLGGVVVLLIWAGIIESFFSQYHAPILPYSVKIAFGMIQTAGLIAYLMLAGRKTDQEEIQ